MLVLYIHEPENNVNILWKLCDVLFISIIKQSFKKKNIVFISWKPTKTRMI